MKTLYGLYVEGSEWGDLADFLAAEGASRGLDPGDPSSWCVPDSARKRIKERLEGQSVEFTAVYDFEAEPADAADDLAAYLGINLLAPEVIVSSNPLLAKDPDDFRIIANGPMLDLLESVTGNLTWDSYEKRPGFSFLRSAVELPDPVEIPRVLDMQRLDDGLWDVSGDGRSIITLRNLDCLKRNGIAYSSSYLINGEIYPRMKFPVFGGKVVQAAVRAGVDLVIYLPHEGIEIDPW
jgi:hypothetical protein